VATALFPFGQPLLPRPPSARERRPVYVLGAYPSGLHVQWKAPALPTLTRRTVRALLVDNEPTPFWSGDGQEDRVEEWRDRVQWQPAWGEVSAPARGVNRCPPESPGSSRRPGTGIWTG